MTTCSSSVAVVMSATNVSGSPARNGSRTLVEELVPLGVAVQRALDLDAEAVRAEVVMQVAGQPRHRQAGPAADGRRYRCARCAAPSSRRSSGGRSRVSRVTTSRQRAVKLNLEDLTRW